MTPRLPILALALLAAACASAREEDLIVGFPLSCAGWTAGPIVGHWRLASFDSEALRVMRITLDAEERGFGGMMICNGYGTEGPADAEGHYAIVDGRLNLRGDLVQTMRYCGDLRVMAAEGAYLDILDSRPHVRLSASGESLCMLTDDGRIIEFSRRGREQA
jgi:heat shock protein HslJ